MTICDLELIKWNIIAGFKISKGVLVFPLIKEYLKRYTQHDIWSLSYDEESYAIIVSDGVTKKDVDLQLCHRNPDTMPEVLFTAIMEAVDSILWGRASNNVVPYYSKMGGINILINSVQEYEPAHYFSREDEFDLRRAMLHALRTTDYTDVVTYLNAVTKYNGWKMWLSQDKPDELMLSDGHFAVNVNDKEYAGDTLTSILHTNSTVVDNLMFRIMRAIKHIRSLHTQTGK